MTVQEAVGKWSEAATVAKAADQFVRDGNWQPIRRALRHCKDGSAVDAAGDLNGDAVLLVTPSEAEPVVGKSLMKLQPFYVVVK